LLLWLLQGIPFLTCLLYFVVLIFSATLHEIAHGWVAYKLGDPTAKMMGRLTLNPRAHLTKMGTLAMLLLPIGWANPVIINPRNFKKPRRDTIIVSLAGPIMNLLICFVSLLVLIIFLRIFGINSPAMNALGTICVAIASVNSILMIFNLIPIPPLDGSKIFTEWLPYKAREWLWRVQQYGIIILFLIIYLIWPFISWLQGLIVNGIYGGLYHLFF